MSMKYSFSIAVPSDDEDLRRIIKETYMPGSISLAFCREPSFFLAENIGCIKSEMMLCRRNDTGKIIGFGGRNLWNVYLNGEKKTVWYLHSLRVLPGERDGIALLRAYQYLHNLQNDSDLPYYLTTVLDENISAKKVLEGKRAGLPAYSKIGVMETHLIPIRKDRKVKIKDRNVNRNDLSTISSACDCINEWNSCYDFSQVYNLDDLKNQNKLFLGFSFKNFFTYTISCRVWGTLGVWDQSSCKQIMVAGYSKKMRIARYFYNFYAGIFGLPYLPKEGEEIKMLQTSFLSAKDNNQYVLDAILSNVVSCVSNCGYDWISVGICKGNNLSKVVSRYSSRRLDSSIYLVHWEDIDSAVLPKAIPHLDIAFL